LVVGWLVGWLLLLLLLLLMLMLMLSSLCRSVDGVVVQRVLPEADVAAIIAEVQASTATSGDA
jgi:hypothetical protein